MMKTYVKLFSFATPFSWQSLHPKVLRL